MKNLKSALTLGLVGLTLVATSSHMEMDLPFNSNKQKDLRSRNIENLHQGTKELIITIDDGPTPGVTDEILKVLEREKIQAAFFVLGKNAKRHPKLMQKIVDGGHIVGNHSMEHGNIGDISGFFKKKKIKEAIIDAHQIIEKYMINSPKHYFRAPYGSWQSKAADVINDTEYGANYYGPLLWDIGGSLDKTLFKVKRAADWGCWSKGWSVRTCLKGYVNETEEKLGGVVLFHDLRKDSIELIDRYIKEFKGQGYRFISLDSVNIK